MKCFLLSSLYISCIAARTVGPPTGYRPASQSHGITNNSELVTGRSFDYIVCGGGLTGLAVASRLTEDPNISVLVIEHGEDNHADPRVADERSYGAAFASELDHNLTSAPVPWQQGKELLIVAGKTLGGSGSINGASWTKGPKSQYDLLPLLTGDASWGWDAFNKHMIKAEHFNLPDAKEYADGAAFAPEMHGYGGPVQVSFAEGIFDGIQRPAIQAAEKVWGLSNVSDAAAGVANGATIIPNMVESDTSQNRSSPFTAYALKQVQQRSNFLILTGHRVTEILWKDGPGLTTKGVHFQACRTCPIHTVSTKHEVLLAAGALQSPQLLELSGVGDPDALKAAGIEVKLASPGVGKHLQEQTKNTLIQTPQSVEFGGTGPPSAIAFPNIYQLLGEANATALHDSVTSNLTAHAHDLASQNLVANATATLAILTAQVDNLFHAREPAAEVFFVTSPATGQVGVDAWNLIVLSRGTVHVRSASAWDHPAIDPRYFGHELDLRVQVAVCAGSRAVADTEPLASMILQEEIPGAEVAEPSDWEDWVKRSFTSVWHPIATLAMMREEMGGVVDARLRVYGVENVRVVDASVLPIQLSAHLSSSLYGIAEKAAEMIREDRERE